MSLDERGVLCPCVGSEEESGSIRWFLELRRLVSCFQTCCLGLFHGAVRLSNAPGWRRSTLISHRLPTPRPLILRAVAWPDSPPLASVVVTLPYPSVPAAGPLALNTRPSSMGVRVAWEAACQAVSAPAFVAPPSSFGRTFLSGT